MREMVTAMLGSDAFWGVIASVVGLAVTAAQSTRAWRNASAWLRERTLFCDEATRARMKAALRAAATRTYSTLVREAKEQAADHRLPAEICRTAMQRTMEDARQIAREEGVPLILEMADAYLQAEVEEVLRDIRREQYDRDPGALRRWLTTGNAKAPQ